MIFYRFKRNAHPVNNQIEISIASNAGDFLEGRKLILEYIEWLSFDLAFQRIDEELDDLEGMYGGPEGALLLARINGKAAGVAGIRKFADGECEVKRMFVKPENRGSGIGKLLLAECIEMAKKLNYDVVRLDTADFMKSAIKLYTDFGFIEIPAYRYNPLEAARYFELRI
jgi:carbonic anhydrase